MNAADTAIAFARAQLGKPYVWGTDGPNTYDCSGLTYASYKAAGVHITRVTGTQIFDGSEVSKTDLAPGDLVFPEPTHVQIYSGNGNIIEAPHSGAFVRERAMYGFWRARRVTDPGTGGNTVPGAVLTAGLPVTPVGNTLDTIGTALHDVVSANFWKRIGFFVLGVAVIYLAIKFVVRDREGNSGPTVVEDIAKAGIVK